MQLYTQGYILESSSSDTGICTVLCWQLGALWGPYVCSRSEPHTGYHTRSHWQKYCDTGCTVRDTGGQRGTVKFREQWQRHILVPLSWYILCALSDLNVAWNKTFLYTASAKNACRFHGSILYEVSSWCLDFEELAECKGNCWLLLAYWKCLFIN